MNRLVDREFKERLEMKVISRGRETTQKLIYNEWKRKVDWANESEADNSGFDSGVSATAS